jgi:hypothetical protein
MTIFTIDAENNITAFPDAEPAEAAAGTGLQTFTSLKELAQLVAEWPVTRLVETWNGFAGVVPLDHLKPVKRFTDRRTAVKRIWQAIQELAVATEAASVAPHGADGAPIANTSNKPAAAQAQRLKTPKSGKRAKPNPNRSSHAQVREGSKKADVLALIEHPLGVTLSEIREATGWLPHSVRGFISGTLGKRMGLVVESTRREDGERVYRLAGVRKEA